MDRDPWIGRIIDAYRVEKVIGRGGMGVVYLAEHLHLGRKVALKLLSPELTSDRDFRDRFIRESRVAASIEHPNVLPVYDAGESEGTLFLAMRYVRGTDLKARLAREGPFPADRALWVIAGVGAGLDAAHARGLVHRDIKPGNVLVEEPTAPAEEEHLFLADFGLTKRMGSEGGITRTGIFVGSLDYAAPEQLEGKDLDGRADIYSLGCMLYELLAGRPPFPRETDALVAMAHLTQEPPSILEARPDLPAGLDRVVRVSMAKDPAARPQTGRSLVREVEEALAVTEVARGTPGISPPPAPVPVAPPKRRAARAGWLAGGAAAALVILGVGLALALSGRSGTTPSTSPTGSSPATATTGSTPSESPTPPALTKTRTRTLIVFDAVGRMLPSFEIDRRFKGECFTASLGDPRSDAWRCSAGHFIFDPCFDNSFTGIKTTVVCPRSPFSDSVTTIQLTKLLPTEFANPGPDKKSLPWALKLADGRECVNQGGGTVDTVGGEPLIYVCGASANIDRSGPVWTVPVVAEDGKTLETVEIQEAWF